MTTAAPSRARESGSAGRRHFNLPPVPPRVLEVGPVDGAAWQRGVTPGSFRKRVLLDGRPVPLAVAASDAGGWVDVEVGRTLSEAGAVVCDTARRRGRVEITDVVPASFSWRF